MEMNLFLLFCHYVILIASVRMAVEVKYRCISGSFLTGDVKLFCSVHVQFNVATVKERVLSAVTHPFLDITSA